MQQPAQEPVAEMLPSPLHQAPVFTLGIDLSAPAGSWEGGARQGLSCTWEPQLLPSPITPCTDLAAPSCPRTTGSCPRARGAPQPWSPHALLPMSSVGAHPCTGCSTGLSRSYFGCRLVAGDTLRKYNYDCEGNACAPDLHGGSASCCNDSGNLSRHIL